MARLGFAGLGTRLTRWTLAARELLFAAWWWTVISALAPVGWLAVMTLPKLSWRWAVIRTLARAALRMLGVPLSVRGTDRIPHTGAIVAFNHASYVDALVVAAALPDEPTYVAKKELAGQIFAGPLLRRLGVLFLDRFDLSDSLADLEAVGTAARQGRILVFFPEGTFTRRVGVSGFYLGAFKIAAQANLPVLPGILRGSRSMLRSDQWFPRWSPISIAIEEPIKPTGNSFGDIVQLRDKVRQVIVAGSGEPDLGELIKPAKPG
jgi:1-acyl-sn-glycerol-3-phosphate acyltransferase